MQSTAWFAEATVFCVKAYLQQVFLKAPLTAASERRFQKGETGERAGNSIRTGGT